MNSFLDLSQQILFIVLTGCGTAVVGVLINYVNQKIDEVQTKKNNDTHTQLKAFVDEAQDTISKVVKAVSQTYVDSLKKSGNFTKEAQEIAKNLAMKTATQLISIEAKKAVEQLHGNFQIYLDTVIESAVNDNKNSKNKDSKGE